MQADSQGGVIANLKDSRPLGMISFAWEDRQVTPQLKDAYMASIRKLLPGGCARRTRTWLVASAGKAGPGGQGALLLLLLLPFWLPWRVGMLLLCMGGTGAPLMQAVTGHKLLTGGPPNAPCGREHRDC